MTQHETRHVELEELKWSLEMPCMLPLCHRFATALGGLERIYSSKEWQSIWSRFCSYYYTYFVLLEVQLSIYVSFWIMFTLDTVLNGVVAYESMCSVYTINNSIGRLSFVFLFFSYTPNNLKYLQSKYYINAYERYAYAFHSKRLLKLVLSVQLYVKLHSVHICMHPRSSTMIVIGRINSCAMVEWNALHSSRVWMSCWVVRSVSYTHLTLPTIYSV